MLACFNVQKTLFFQILYIIVGPLCPVSLKRFAFYKAPPSDKHSLLWLANLPSALWLAEHHKPFRKCLPLSKIASFSFQNECKDLIMSLVFPSVQAWEGNRVAWQTQWWSSYVFANKPRLRWFLMGCTLRCDVTLSLTHTRAHAHTCNSQ